MLHKLSIVSVLSLVLFFGFLHTSHAGNSVTVNRGNSTTYVGWSIMGGHNGNATCAASASTNIAPSGVRNAWMTYGGASLGGTVLLPALTEVFTNGQFTCTHAGSGSSDTSSLTVNDCPSGQTWNGSSCVAVVSPPGAFTLSGTAGACGSGRIDMSWTASSGATNYVLEHWSGGTWYSLYSGTNRTYSQSGLPAGAAYSLRVTATNAGGATYSNIVDINAPAACGEIQFTSASCTYLSGTYRIALSWNAVSGATNYPMRISGPSYANNATAWSASTSVRGFNNGSADDTTYPAPTGTSFTFTGLTTAGTYSYWGHSWSSSMGWNPPSPTAYTVTCSPPATYSCTGSVPANAAAWDAEESSSLTANTAWTYAGTDTTTKCQYTCASGYSWNGSSCTAPTGGTCSGTQDVTVTGGTTGAVWGTNFYTDDSTVGTAAVHVGLITAGQSATIRKTFGGVRSDYVGSTRNGVTTSSYSSPWCSMTLSLVSGGTFACTGSVPANAQPWAADESTGLTSSAAWTYSSSNTTTKCQYTCNSGYTWDGASCVAAGSPPTTPTNVTVGPGRCMTDSAIVDWTSVTGADQYSVRRFSSTGSLIATYYAFTSRYTDTGLTPSTTYGYRVRAENAFGNSTYSPIVYGMSSPGTCPPPPPTPTGLTATPDACGTRRINVSWNASTNATEYELYRNGSRVYRGSNLTYEDRPSAGSSNTYTVLATGEGGSSAQSSGVTATAPSSCSSGCTAQTIANCVLPSGTNGNSVSGSCASGYAGTCSYTCSSGSWTTPSTNTCSAPVILTFRVCTTATGVCTNAPGPHVVATGTPLRIEWTSQNADNCQRVAGPSDFDPAGVANGNDAVTASATSNATTTYTIMCRQGTNNTTAAQRSLDVYTMLPAPTLTASSTVQQGSTVRLNWDTNNSNEGSCTLRDGGGTSYSLTNGTGGAETGWRDIVINGRTTFTLTCGTLSAVKTIEIIPITWES